MNKKFVVALLSLAISTLTFSQSSGKDPKAKVILDKTSATFKTFKSLQANFTFSLHSPAGGMDETRKGLVYLRGDKSKIEFKTGDFYLNDGNYLYELKKEDLEINKMCPEELDESMDVTKMSEVYKAGYKYILLSSQSTVVGKVCHTIDLEPDLSPEKRKYNTIFKIRLHIDAKTYTLVKWEIFEKNGNRYTVTIDSIKPNAVIPTGKLSFSEARYPNYDLIDLCEE